ncbi:MAG TPA: hypothetical protein VNE41_06750 [Chitinophagaceae bacterium]|nr:hypothetical protein [Chitinophagaceae bacterium]
MSEFESRKNVKALAWTLGVHGCLLLAFIFFGFTSQPPLPNQDLGMEINLGTSAQGTGNIQPLNPNPPAVSRARPLISRARPAPKISSKPPDIVTQDNPDAPVIKQPDKPNKTAFSKTLDETNKKVTPRIVPRNVPVTPKPAPARPKAIYSGGAARSSGSGNNAGASNDSRNEGLTGQPGDQGAVNGNPTAANHQGVFSGLGGNSLSYRLNGRNIVQYPGKQGDFNEPGLVQLNIKVDQHGNIIDATIISAANETVRELALRKIKQVKFNADPNAPVVQFGNITFVFKIQQ